MSRNIEEITKQLFGRAPLPSVVLADNALKLGGIKANLYALKTDLDSAIAIINSAIDDIDTDLQTHKGDDERHLTAPQILKIAEAINSVTAHSIAIQEINSHKDAIIATALADSEEYTDEEVVGLMALISANLQQSKEYSDANLEIAKDYTDTNLQTAKDYSDTNLGTSKGYTDTKLQESKNYSDANLETAKDYSDNNLESAKTYSDANLETAKGYSDANLQTSKNYSDGNLQTAKDYSDGNLVVGKAYTDEKHTASIQHTDTLISNLNLGPITNPDTQEPETIVDTLNNTPSTVIDPAGLKKFKNMMENSSFEVYDGVTLRPMGWDAGEVEEDASVFGTYSLKLSAGQTAKQVPNKQADTTWYSNVNYTSILAFYHKGSSVTVRVYDIENSAYLMLQRIDATGANSGTPATAITFSPLSNWYTQRDMLTFTRQTGTRKVRIEFTAGDGVVYIDAPVLEPRVGLFPSFYTDGRYSVSANQIVTYPPDDMDRYKQLEDLRMEAYSTDASGNTTDQRWYRSDNTLAVKRVATNPNASGYYQTITETFYMKDGVTVNYTDTYTRVYNTSGVVTSETRTSTEVRD